MSGGSIILPDTSLQTYTPVVTLVGGGGNTVPQYTTNTGQYLRIGSRVFCEVYLTGDGGNEGAGTGQINISLPVTAHSTQPTDYIQAGSGINSTTKSGLFGQTGNSATTIALATINAGALTAYTGANQSNSTRSIRLCFNYAV